MMPVQVPEAVRICERCGELAAGDGCVSCRQTEAAAVRFARWGVLQGASRIEIQRKPSDTQRQKLFCDLMEAQFHCLRLAAFSARLPRQEGLQVEPRRPGAFETWGAVGRWLALPLAVVAAAAVLVVLVLL